MSDVTFERDDYKYAKPDWVKVATICEGQRAVKAAKDTYLPDPNMVGDSSDDKAAVYKAYLQRAMFFNITGSTLNNLVGTAFKDLPGLTTPDAIGYVATDADGAGVSIYQQAQSSVSEALQKGRGALWVDYPKTDAPASLADQQAGLIRANIILVKAEDITNWRVEQVGGKQILSLVVFKDHRTKTDGFGQESETIYRVLRMIDGAYVAEVWVKGDDNAWFPETSDVILDGNGSTWNTIPFYFFGAQNNDSEIDKAPLIDLADLNIKHYQVAADWYNALFYAGQPQPVLAGLTEAWRDHMEAQGVVLGSRAPVMLPTGASFQYATVAADAALQTELEKLEKRMQAIGARLITPGEAVMTATQARDQNIAQHSVLSLVAQNVGEAYTEALKAVAKFMRVTGDVMFALSTVYTDRMIDAQVVTALVAANQAGKLPDSDLFRLMREMNLVDPEKTDQDIAEELARQGGGVDLAA